MMSKHNELMFVPNYNTVTIHDQATADEWIPKLLAAPGEPRVVVADPMTGPVDLKLWVCPECKGTGRLQERHDYCTENLGCPYCHGDTPIDLVICQGGDDPTHPDWVRSLRDQCVAAGVPFTFLGWGEWAPVEIYPEMGIRWERINRLGRVITGLQWFYEDTDVLVARVGKANSGRLLDGRVWDEMPA